MRFNSLTAARRGAPFLVALVAGILLATFVQAAPRQSVSLVYFRGEDQGNAARLEWRTATEDNTYGFRLERGPSAAGPFTPLSELDLIEAQGSPVTGNTYEARDETVSPGQTYWYRLVEVELDNSESPLDITHVTIAGPTPTAEPVTGGGDSGSSPAPPPTSTSALTSTPEPTQAGGGDDDAAPTATQSGGGATMSARTNTPGAATTAPDENNNLPTNTPPPSPTRMTFDQGGDNAEAADVSAVAQVTPTEGTDGYPGPADEAPEDTSAIEEQSPAEESYPGPNEMEVEIEEQPPETLDESAYPSGVAGGPGAAQNDGMQSDDQRSVGAGDAPEISGDEAQEAAESTLSRAILWIGFAIALLIFIGGTILAIVLSTRKRNETLS